MSFLGYKYLTYQLRVLTYLAFNFSFMCYMFHDTLCVNVKTYINIRDEPYFSFSTNSIVPFHSHLLQVLWFYSGKKNLKYTQVFVQNQSQDHFMVTVTSLSMVYRFLRHVAVTQSNLSVFIWLGQSQRERENKKLSIK